MFNVISLDNVSLAMNNKMLFSNLNLEVASGSFVSIIGKSNSGKSSFVKLLAGLLQYRGYININGYSLDDENISSIRKGVSVVFSDDCREFSNFLVYDILSLELVHMGLDRKTIDKKVSDVSSKFLLDDILYTQMGEISESRQVLVMVLSSVLSGCNILIMDDCLDKIIDKDKNKLMKYLKKLKKTDDLTVLMTTHEMENVLYCDKVIVLDEGKKVYDDSIRHLFEDRQVLKKFDIEVPFVVNLSYRLVKEGRISNICLDERKLVDELWK